MIFIDNKYTKWYNNIILNARSRISITGYTEIHHIIPKSIGGNNTQQNLAILSAKEHFICHMLLPKMVYGKNKTKMHFAFWCLCNRMKDNILNINSRTYQQAKENFSIENSILHSGKVLSQETKDKLSIAHRGKKLSEEHKAKINPTGRVHTEDTKLKISKGQIGRVGGMQDKHHSEETKRKISEGNVGKIMPPITEIRRRQVSDQFKGTTQSVDHKNKRLKARQENGFYKDKESTLKKMSESAKNRPKYKCHCGIECTASNFKRWHGDNCKN